MEKLIKGQLMFNIIGNFRAIMFAKQFGTSEEYDKMVETFYKFLEDNLSPETVKTENLDKLTHLAELMYWHSQSTQPWIKKD